jgi:hypothetical protein
MIAAPFGTAFEIIINMTDDLTLTNAATNLVVGLSGLSGGKTLTLPAISQMVASQNLQIKVVNKSSSGGTITIAPNAADSTIIGQVTCLVATGVTFFHNGLNQWYGI